MTFQVALVGTDCLVLGSDRLTSYRPTLVGDEIAFNQKAGRTKFVSDRDDSPAIVCAIAGESPARRLAEQIVSEFDPSKSAREWLAYLDRHCTQVQQQRTRDQILVVRSDMPHLAVWMRLGVEATPIEDKICSGASLSSCFLLDRYFDKSLPIESLKNLALLTLDSAAIEAPERVGGGYDLAVWKDGSVNFSTYTPEGPKILAMRAALDNGAEDAIRTSSAA